MSVFVFESYEFDAGSKTAIFRYSFDGERQFAESVVFAEVADRYDDAALERAMFLAFAVIGISYYKLFPGSEIQWRKGTLDAFQVKFLNQVYQEGLGQFAYENNLTRDGLGWFAVSSDSNESTESYVGAGILSLQSGGKDSLLTATFLEQAGCAFDSFYISAGESHPSILGQVGDTLLTAKRNLDLAHIKQAMADGGKNGHVPVTYIVSSIALVQAVLCNKKYILTSVGHEGEEPHAMIGDLPVAHQWAKTWGAEQLFAEYVQRYVSPDLFVGSLLRQYSELRITELFAGAAWEKYGHSFSSCNLANYAQGTDNTVLRWCGECPKCANSYLLFAPFVEPVELQGLFGGEDLFAKPSLAETFKGLLGVDDTFKPFECVGEVDELRTAYHMTQGRGYAVLPFDVPEASYDYRYLYPQQEWTKQLIDKG